MIVITKPPFLIARVGWGYFTVEVEIEFQPRTGLTEVMKLEHELNFDKDSTHKNFIVEVE